MTIIVRVFLAAAVLGLGISPVLFAAPAFAHHPIISGEALCNEDGTQTVTWTLTNSESVEGTNRSMTIDRVTIDRGEVGYGVGQTFPPTPLPDSSQVGGVS